MSRLKYQKGDEVRLQDGVRLYIVDVQPALEAPYFCSDSQWHEEDALDPYVPSTPTWEEVERMFRHMVEELRAVFQEHDAPYMAVEFVASGRPDGVLKLTMGVSGQEYGSGKVTGYSIRPTLDEFFRRKAWSARNEPLALTHGGTDD